MRISKISLCVLAALNATAYASEYIDSSLMEEGSVYNVAPPASLKNRNLSFRSPRSSFIYEITENGKVIDGKISDEENSTISPGPGSFKLNIASTVRDLTIQNLNFQGSASTKGNTILSIPGSGYKDLILTLNNIKISNNQVWSQGGLIQTAGSVICENVIFEENDGSSAGFNPHLWVQKDLIINNSSFINNISYGDAAALYAGTNTEIVFSGNPPEYFTNISKIKNSVFKKNHNGGYRSADWRTISYGGAIGFDFSKKGIGTVNPPNLPQKIYISDSSFYENSVIGKGGAIGINFPKITNSLFISAIENNVSFERNTQNGDPNDIYIEKGQLYLNAYGNKNIKITGGIQANRLGRIFFNFKEPDISPESPNGTIILEGPVISLTSSNFPAELHGGTLLINFSDAFRTTTLWVLGDSRINTINNNIQDIFFNNLQVEFDKKLKLSVDVDLLHKSVDTFNLSPESYLSWMSINNDVNISQWNLLSNSAEPYVIVRLTKDEMLSKALGLDNSAAEVTYSDPIMRSSTLWKVIYLASDDSDSDRIISDLGIGSGYTDNGHFLFYRPEEDPEEPEVPTDPDPTDPTDPTNPEPTPEPTPVDFNPDLYQGSVAMAGIGVIQHAITNSLFSDFGNRSADGVLLEEPPVHNPWWVKVLGSDFDMKPKNFSSLDLKYSIAMIGHDFDPMNLGNDGKLYCGVYGGWAGAKHEFESSYDVKQNGAFIGLNALYTKGNFHVSGHLNVGKMYNDYSSDFGSLDNQNNWLGAGVNASYFLDLPAYRTVVRMGVTGSFVRINADDFTTQRGVDVHMSDVDSREISPGFTVTKFFDHGWKASATARYAWVDESNDGIRVPEYGPVPTIGFDDYVEYGAGIQKQSKDDLWTLDLLRSDKGRRGFSVQLRYGWRF